MKTSYLFPHRFILPAGIIFIISLLSLVLYTTSLNDLGLSLNTPVFAIMSDDVIGADPVYFGTMENNIIDELLILAVILSGIVLAFAKEKHEDEMVANIRLQSLAWATIANYGIITFCYLFIYGLPFLTVLMVAMFSQLLIFIVLFRYKMVRFYNTLQHEE